MPDVPADVSSTVLTERQAEVLAMRAAGRTQAEIAASLGTSVANVSAVERAARENVAAARRTIELVRMLEARTRISAAAGTDLRALVDRVYAAADDVDLRLPHSDPELTALLHDRLGDRLDGRELTGPVDVGLTATGSIVVFPGGTGADRLDRPTR